MKMALIGLGKMGANMARRLCRGGVEVVGYNRSQEIVRSLAQEEGMLPADSLLHAVEQLASPKIVWLMLPSGAVTENSLLELIPLLSAGDIVIDGGNATARYRFHGCRHLRRGVGAG